MTANPLQAGGGLLPCPFDGRQPEITERAAMPSERAGYMCFIACMCGGYSARAHHFGKGDSPEEARANASAAWNRRASTSGPAGEAVAKPLEERAARIADQLWLDTFEKAKLIRLIEQEFAVPPSIPADAKPAYWAVHSRTGMHIGLWPDRADADEALREYEGGTIEPLFKASAVQLVWAAAATGEAVADLIERLAERAASYRLGGPSSEHTAAMLDEAAASLSQLSTKLENAERERNFEQSSRLTSEAQLGTQIENLIRERDELRAKLAEAIKVIDLAVDLQCELGSHYELRAAAIRARAVQGAGQS